MVPPKLGPKNVSLAKLLYRLRQDIDLYRVIALNTEPLRKRGGSKSFWVHVQTLAHESLALTICKIYEPEKRNDLNSIPGIISIFPSAYAPEQRLKIMQFGCKFVMGNAGADCRSYIQTVFSSFRNAHAESLRRLKLYRNKLGAHSEHGAVLESLPSMAEFEALFQFADGFYQLSDSLLDIGPAAFKGHVGKGVLRVMKALGIENPKYDFDAQDA